MAVTGLDYVFSREDLLDDEEDIDTGEESELPDPSAPPLGLSQEQWSLLTMSPMTVFLLVAAADGEIDDKELETFQKAVLEKVVFGDNKLLSLIGAECIADMAALYSAAAEMELTNHINLLLTLRDIVDEHLPEADAQALLTALYNLGHSVASASGGFFGFGSKIGKEEKKMLDFLKITLLEA